MLQENFRIGHARRGRSMVPAIERYSRDFGGRSAHLLHRESRLAAGRDVEAGQKRTCSE